MAQNLTEFIQEQNEKIVAFEKWWQLMHKRQPEQYPLTFKDGSEGLWWEMFNDFEISYLADALDKPVGYYVSHADGKVYSTNLAPFGCHFEYHEENGTHMVSIVDSGTGEVNEECVLWSSLEDMASSGIDVSGVLEG